MSGILISPEMSTYVKCVPSEGPALRGEAGGPELTGLGWSLGRADGQRLLFKADGAFL